MKQPETTNTAGLFIEIGQSLLKVANGGGIFEFPIERGENGRLTDLCRERLTTALGGYLNRKTRAATQSAWCAISARGVSLRRLTLPASSKEEFKRVLRLKIESEFPLAPDELAWGWRQIGAAKAANGGPAPQELLVVAVKKEMLEEYASILTDCGITPVFTLAALARAELYTPPSGSGAVLDIGRTHSELMSIENGIPISIRMLPWGGETITRSIQEKLGLSHDEAEKLKLASNQPGPRAEPPGQSLQNAVEPALAALVTQIRPAPPGGRLYLTGKSARDPRMALTLTNLFGGVVKCESLEPATTGLPAGIAGLMKSTSRTGTSAPLILEMAENSGAAGPARTAIWKWAAVAAALTLGALLFPYAEALVFKPFLEKKLAGLQTERGRLAVIDEELDFLKYLKQNQPPYLEAIYVLAKSAPQGTRLESLSMSRHPDVSIQLKMGNAQQVSDFRAKLVDSGWFNNVVVEEQSPSPDRQLTVRMTADLKPAESRKPLVAEPPSTSPRPTIMESAPGQPPPMMAAPAVMNPAASPDGQDAAGPRRGGRRGRGGASPLPEGFVPPDL